jgi:hypothetical protein
MTRTIYVAGPMQGLPEHGYPAFDAACSFLRNQWRHLDEPVWNVLSPHEVDNGETPDNRGTTKDHWDYMRLDMALLVTCDAICLLDGWARSRGAVQELNCAIAMGLDIFRYDQTVSAPDNFYQIG